MGKDEPTVMLTVRVQPRAAHTAVMGFMDDGAIKVRLNAPPVEGKANEALIHFLADILGVGKDAVQIKSGLTSRTKVVRIVGLTLEEVKKKLADLIH